MTIKNIIKLLVDDSDPIYISVWKDKVICEKRIDHRNIEFGIGNELLPALLDLRDNIVKRMA